MLFNSLVFLYLFFPVAYFVFWRLQGKTARYVWLTLTGYAFYAGWNYKFCALMAFSTIVSFLAGLGFLRWEDPRHRKLCLVVPITVDLLLLGYFKYANFTLRSVESAAGWFGSSVHLPLLSIVLPVGISFYTFHTITYIVDSYRRVIVPTRHFFEFSCYVSLFPQLVAGPIVRFRQIESDLEHVDGADRKRNINLGCSFFALGLIKKVLIADTIAKIINPALHGYTALSTAGSWLCALGYTYQLYFDFSGYSDMAVGLGYLFGIRLPQNFDSPYKAVDISDFWRRLHISLSSVLRDYLYVPLGGNRGGTGMVYRNLLITMLLGGLWHGAAWTFVIWGGYHGVLLALNRSVGKYWSAMPLVAKRLGTFLLVVIGWVLFRSDDFRMAATWLSSMFVPHPGALFVGAGSLVMMILLSAVIAHFGPNTFEMKHDWRPAMAGALGVLFLFCLIVITSGRQSPFLYFQF